MRFSKANQCFYPESFKYQALPADIQPCSDEDFHKALERPSGYSLDIKEGKIILVPPPAKTFEQAMLEKTRAIAAKRYEKEISGVSFGDFTIFTDRASVAMLDSTLEKIRRGLISSIQWKCDNNQYLTLTAANADAVELAVLLHVQTCFEKERQMVEAVGKLADVNAVESFNVEF